MVCARIRAANRVWGPARSQRSFPPAVEWSTRSGFPAGPCRTRDLASRSHETRRPAGRLRLGQGRMPVPRRSVPSARDARQASANRCGRHFARSVRKRKTTGTPTTATLANTVVIFPGSFPASTVRWCMAVDVRWLGAEANDGPPVFLPVLAGRRSVAPASFNRRSFDTSVRERRHSDWRPGRPLLRRAALPYGGGMVHSCPGREESAEVA